MSSERGGVDSIVRDVVGLVGLVLVAAGVGRMFGWPAAAVTVGAVLLGLAVASYLVVGEREDPRQ